MLGAIWGQVLSLIYCNSLNVKGLFIYCFIGRAQVFVLQAQNDADLGRLFKESLSDKMARCQLPGNFCVSDGTVKSQNLQYGNKG